MSTEPPTKPARRRPRYFPSPEHATPEGAVVMGGDLNPELLLDAYSHGIFPWPHSDEEPMVWWSLDPRAIIEFANFRPSRRALRRLRAGQYVASMDTDFRGVMKGCAEGPGREGGTWITPNMIRGYTRLHRLGHAHSIEIRHDNNLVGGVYGVSVGGLFAAESMFHRERDASTCALAVLIAHLKARGYGFLDVQQWTSHTGHLGATEIPREEYLDRLAIQVERPVTFGQRLEGDPLGFRK